MIGTIQIKICIKRNIIQITLPSSNQEYNHKTLNNFAVKFIKTVI